MLFSFNAAEVFQIAIEIEENGRVFYEKAQDLVDDPAVKELFADLALQEIEHKKKFQSLKASLAPQAGAPTVWDPDNETDQYLRMMADQHIFGPRGKVGDHLARISNAVDALKLAIQFEKDSVIFFLGMQEVTTEEAGRELIGVLVREESSHLRRLAGQLQSLTAGR